MSRAQSRQATVVACALLVVGAALHGYLAFATTSLNTDEVYYALRARDGGLGEAVLADVHPPLYPLALGALVRLGVPEAGWRLFSVACWLATGWFGYCLARRCGERLGLSVLTLIVFAPQAFVLSSMVRSYALAACLAAATLLLAVRLLVSPVARRAIGLAVVAALGAHTFYYNAYLLVGLLAAALWLRARAHPAAKHLAVAAGLAALSLVPWLWFAGAQFHTAGGGWIKWAASPLPVARRVTQLLAAAGGVGGIEPWLRLVLKNWTGEIVTAGLVLWVAWGLWRGMRQTDETARTAWTVMGIVGTVTIAVAFASHWFFGVFIAVHYFVILTSLAATLFAAPFALARSRWALAALLLLVAANLGEFKHGPRATEPVKSAVAWLDERLGAHDLVLGVAWFVVDGYRFYGRGRLAAGVPADLRPAPFGPRVQPGVMDAADLPALHTLLAAHRRVGLLLSHTTWQNTEDRGEALVKRALDQAGFVEVERQAWPIVVAANVRAEIWQKPGAGEGHP
jgi:hypothetical protein